MKFQKLHRLPLLLALGGVWIITACNTPSRHRLLTVFFDGVPPLNAGTNAAPVAAPAPGAIQVPGEVPKTNAPPVDTFTVHPPFREHNCEECHESGSGQGLRVSPPQLCWTCHKDFLAGQQVKHQPVEDGECTSCHDPHQSENKNLLLQKGNALCLTCHDDPLAAGQYKHQAVESGDCLDCHAPHATNFKGLLRKSVKDTCADCHDDLTKKKDVHQPVADGDCLECHEAHASNKKHLVKKNTPALCWDCHDNFLEKAKFQHDVVEDCTGCHDPHQSAENNLLTKNILQLCGDCHDDKDLKTDKGHAGFEGKSCTVCHDPHVGTNVNLLKPSAMAK
jgi:predicted CXXCH cytochrome family protein